MKECHFLGIELFVLISEASFEEPVAIEVDGEGLWRDGLVWFGFCELRSKLPYGAPQMT